MAARYRSDTILFAKQFSPEYQAAASASLYSCRHPLYSNRFPMRFVVVRDAVFRIRIDQGVESGSDHGTYIRP